MNSPGRFLTLRPAEREGMPAERTHYLDSFEVLVPQDMWSLDEIPEYDENDVVPGDGSWENRIRFAAVVMRHMLNGGQSLTTYRSRRLNSATETPATQGRPPTWPHNFWTIDGTPPDTTNRASFGPLIGDCGVFMNIPSASRN